MSAQILYQIALPARHGVPQLVEAFSSPDGTLGVSADRVKILQGRMFSSRAPGQAVIDPQLASLVHLRPGGTLHLLGIPDNPRTGEPDLSRAIPLAFRVTAIAVFDTADRPHQHQLQRADGAAQPAVHRHARGTVDLRLRKRGRGAAAAGREHDHVPARPPKRLAKRYPATGGKLAVISLVRSGDGDRAGDPAAGGGAGDLRGAGRADWAGRDRPVAGPPDGAGLGGVPHPARRWA